MVIVIIAIYNNNNDKEWLYDCTFYMWQYRVYIGTYIHDCMIGDNNCFYQIISYYLILKLSLPASLYGRECILVCTFLIA